MDVGGVQFGTEEGRVSKAPLTTTRANHPEPRSMSESTASAFFQDWLSEWKDRLLESEWAGVTGTRLPFHQRAPVPRVRGVRTTGRGSVDRTKRSQAFSIQSLGQNPCANCISNRRIIRQTTYLS